MPSLLLDMHILIPLLEDELESLRRPIVEALRASENQLFASVASLWEAAIKHRSGKLPLTVKTSDWPDALLYMRIGLYGITAEHATVEVDPWPPTNDPFDRVLLATCLVQGMRLVTTDRKLIDHPLAYRPAA